MAGKQKKLGLTGAKKSDGPVECLGIRFENDTARRAHFGEQLRQKLQDPEFRSTPGFPHGSDEAILRMSDPPYYTACPNPFLGDFVREHGTRDNAGGGYHRRPFALDVSVGKTSQLYRAHGYHTKVPHLAIVPSILHYTEPGDIVLDGFCGSGMTGVAAQFCGTAPRAYRDEVAAEWKKQGLGKPRWGARRAVLNDLGPAATFIAANYNIPFDLKAFERAALRLLGEVEDELGWMYETMHHAGSVKGRINYTVWSEVFSCPECAGEVVFLDEALDRETQKTRKVFPCPHCDAELNKKRLERHYESTFDQISGDSHRAPKRRPVIINYTVDDGTFEKKPDEHDMEVIARVGLLPLPPEVPTTRLPYMHMTHERARMDSAGVTHLHHFFFPRAAQALASLWRKANSVPSPRTRQMLLWFVEQAIWGMSILARYAPTHFSQVNQYLNGVYYVGSQIVDVSPWYILHDPSRRTSKLSRLGKAFSPMPTVGEAVTVSTGDCARQGLPDRSVDYIFTDPPFGENIYYADLNYLVEAWHGVKTSANPEAIVDRAKDKGLHEYQALMRDCFREYARVLKPGRWMTIVFSNSRNSVWRAIQEALGTAGFVVADVRTLDKKQGSYRQVTSSAVKQDLVISSYKPTEALAQRFELGSSSTDDAWAFIREHLGNVPVFADRSEDIEVVAERTAQTLHDRMIAFFVQRGVAVPLSGPEFFEGLDRRFARRDGMHFLPDQVSRYDKKRAMSGEVRQLSLFVQDEASSIRWLRQILDHKPQTFQDLVPQFMKVAASWAKHERTVELRDLLHENFLHNDGTGPVPAPIHSYLSSNLKLRNLDKSDPRLRSAGRGRWYVPSVHRQGDLEQLRIRALLREFEEYKRSTQRKIKQFRTEAVRAGFKAAYDARDYRTIIEVATKLPDKVIQEDEKLVMYLDVAQMRYEHTEQPTLF